MTARRCARCGTAVGPDEYLCSDCRQELPARAPAAAHAAAAGSGTVPPGGPGDEVRTFRGAPVPRGMVLPSRVQYHGTVFGLVALGIVIVLTLGVLVSTGVGPFIASGITVSQVTDNTTGQARAAVTATVTNRGDHAGTARCVALYTDASGGQVPTQSVETHSIAPHGVGSVTIDLPTGASPSHVTVDCK